MFSVQTSRRDGALVVRVEGDVDMATAPQLAAAVDDVDGLRGVVLDVAGVAFMSSAGLGVVSALNRRVRAAGGELVVAGARPDVSMLLEVTGLAAHVGVAADADAALSGLPSA